MELQTEEFEIDGIKYKIIEMNANKSFKMMSLDKEQGTRHLLISSVIEPKIDNDFLEKLGAKNLFKLLGKINALNGFGEDFPKVPEASPKPANGSSSTG